MTEQQKIELRNSALEHARSASLTILGDSRKPIEQLIGDANQIYKFLSAGTVPKLKEPKQKKKGRA